MKLVSRPRRRPTRGLTIRGVAVLAIVALPACRDGTPPIGPRANMPESPPFRVTVDPAPYLSLTDDQRRALEDDAIQRIVSRIPAEHRARAETLLRQSETPAALGFTTGHVAASSFAGSTDPEIARNLGIIASVRAATSNLRLSAMNAVTPAVPAKPSAHQPSARTRIFVTVAYDASRSEPVALFGPGYQLPILVLGAGATPADLRAGLRAAAKLARQFGPEPTEHYRAVVHQPDKKGSAAESTERLLQAIQSAAKRVIPGVGELPALEVVTYEKK